MAQASRKEKQAEATLPARAGAQAQTASARQDWLFWLGLLVAILVVYSPMWQAGFIWDDDWHVPRPEMRTWAGLGRIWFQLGATQQYYPLLESTFWAQYQLWADHALGYHLVNILLHAFSAFLLLNILRRLEVPGAWLATAIFALHPVQVESVAWVTELKNVLSGVFYFGATLVYLTFDRTRKQDAYAASLALFILGLLSKTVIATLPAALLVIFWWKRGRLSWKQDVLPLVPFFLVGLGSGLFTAWMERHLVGADGANYKLTLLERTLVAGHDLCFYFSKLVWPANLIFIYPRWNVSEATVSQYFFPVVVFLVAIALMWLSRWWRGPLAGFLFFAGTLFPALGFSNVYAFRYSFVADHWQYLACLGVMVPCAAGATLLWENFLPESLRLRRLLCAGLLLVLGLLSWQRTWVYQDEETLWRKTLAQNPECWIAQNNLGFLLFQKGQVDNAIALFQQALQFNPDYAEAHYSLGMALFQKQAQSKDQQTQLVIHADDGSPYHLGLALYKKGQIAEAIGKFQEALKINPNDAAAHFSLGLALSPKGSADATRDSFPEARDITPNYARIYYSLGLALLRQGKPAESLADFEEALKISPRDVETRNDLGIALFQNGQVDEAIRQFQEALKIDPNNAQAHNNLGNAFFQKGRMADAIEELQNVVRLNPSDANAQNSLSQLQALARQGHAAP